jgi:hypothetical protein
LSWCAGGRYQLEVPEYVLKRSQPAEYSVKSKKKGYLRFYSPNITQLLERLAQADEQLVEAQRDEMRRLFERFDKSRDTWAAAVRPHVQRTHAGLPWPTYHIRGSGLTPPWCEPGRSGALRCSTASWRWRTCPRDLGSRGRSSPPRRSPSSLSRPDATRASRPPPGEETSSRMMFSLGRR